MIMYFIELGSNAGVRAFFRFTLTVADAQLGHTSVFQKDGIANAEDQLRYRFTDYLLPAKCLTN